jgi:hypothetical protein
MVKLKGLTTESPSAKAKAALVDPRPATAPRRGPAVGQNDEVAAATRRAMATKEELAELDAKIAARLAQVGRIWAACDGGMGCNFVFEVKEENLGSPCIKCNFPGRATSGGKMQRMTAEHLARYQKWLAETKAKAQERQDRIEFEDEQTNRRKIGKVPFASLAEWKAARVAAFQEKLQHEAEVAAGWAAQKKGATK